VGPELDERFEPEWADRRVLTSITIDGLAVQAARTWDLYGHLFPNRPQEVAETLDTGARAAGMYKACTKSEVLPYLLAAQILRIPGQTLELAL
jgi:hypothetical protein